MLYFLPGAQYLPLLLLVLPVITMIAAIVLCPLEALVKMSYIRRAKRKLFSPKYQHLIRIGIAGSHGKTTCKNILAAMLSKKYRVITSPASFNTPMGFTRTVLEKLSTEDQVFIMEMGERHPGDIREMCKLLKPHHAILTSVGTAHLETFKTPEAIRDELYELVNAVPEGGIKVTGEESPKGKVYKTKLLGAHNQQNINLCAQMAAGLGVSDEDIRAAVLELEPVPHRLQLIESPNGVKILDDSYNSSPHTVMAALEVLKQLKEGKISASSDTCGERLACGGTKQVSESSTIPSACVMTPGMVELGKQQGYVENFNFGKTLATVADHVIIVGETNRKAIRLGLLEGGFTESNIHLATDVTNAKKLFPKLLKPGDILLISNDLPDNFT